MKFQKDQARIVRTLCEKHVMTAAGLSEQLGISVRTIRTLVREINELFPDAILSSPEGYAVARERIDELTACGVADIPQNSDERILYIANQLVHREGDALDLYDLCEELFVGLSTLNIDLQKLRRRLAEYDLRLVTKSDAIRIDGSEKNMRKFISSLLYEESNVNFVDLASLQNKFPDIDMAFIRNTALVVFKRHGYYINDFSLINLVLHIAISIDRIRRGNISTQAIAQNQAVLALPEYAMTREIVDQLESHFSVAYNGMETYEMTLLVLSRTSAVHYGTVDASHVEQYIDKGCLGITNQIIDRLQELYDVNFSERDFVVRFSIHLQDLFIRSQNNYFSRNPLTQSIKTSCPFLYDMAVSVAAILKSNYGIAINDDEIAYVAVHLGSMLEEQRSLQSRITAALYCPNYYNIVQTLTDELTRRYGNKLLVSRIFTSENQIEQLSDIDLIITVIPLSRIVATPFIQIQPFLTDRDRSNLNETIELIEQRKKHEQLSFYLHKLFKPELFERVSGFSGPEECIEFMVNGNIAHGYTADNFLGCVLDREKMSSTALGSFAMPHSILMNASRTAFHVLISEKAIPWGGNHVKLVILMCFNKNERHIFNLIFEPLIEVLNERECVKKLCAAKTYDDFIAVLERMMK